MYQYQKLARLGCITFIRCEGSCGGLPEKPCTVVSLDNRVLRQVHMLLLVTRWRTHVLARMSPDKSCKLQHNFSMRPSSVPLFSPWIAELRTVTTTKIEYLLCYHYLFAALHALKQPFNKNVIRKQKSQEKDSFQ